MSNLPSTKKELGQHWLTDEATLEEIANSIDIDGKTTVLEIGPGAGTLTNVLLKKAKRVVAVEFDAKLAKNLTKQLNNPSNLQVVESDILKFDLTTLPKNYIIVANIPYYLTSKLIRILSESSNPPMQTALLVQKEVAERVCAAPGKTSMLSISTQIYNDVFLGVEVPARLFTPPPKVDSQTLILTKRVKPLVQDVMLKDFFVIVRAGFNERRKKLRSSLSSSLRLPKPETDELLKASGVNPSARAQELNVQDWVNITIQYIAIYK